MNLKSFNSLQSLITKNCYHVKSQNTKEVKIKILKRDRYWYQDMKAWYAVGCKSKSWMFRDESSQKNRQNLLDLLTKQLGLREEFHNKLEQPQLNAEVYTCFYWMLFSMKILPYYPYLKFFLHFYEAIDLWLPY